MESPGHGTLGFNSRETIYAKTARALGEGHGGVMIWEVAQDCRLQPVERDGKAHPATCPRGARDSLLLAVEEAVGEAVAAARSGEL